MDKLISEQAVIDSIEFFQMNPQHFSFANLIDDIKEIPPGEPKWILVSEKLPIIHNRCENYLVTLKRGGVHIALYTECDGKHWWSYDDVVAWLPSLPKSYKAESEG